MAMRPLIAAMAAAMKNGRCDPPSAARAPMAGPMTNPTPKAAPRRPMRRARCDGGDTSPTAAWATDTDAPDTPSRMRPRKRIQIDPATPVSNDPRAVPKSDRSRIGLRPNRSLRRPHTGAKISWASENDADSTPISAAPTPKRSAYCGRIGRTIPNPMRSMATVVQMTPNPRGSGGRSPEPRPSAIGRRPSGGTDLRARRGVLHDPTVGDQLIPQGVGPSPVLRGAGLVALNGHRPHVGRHGSRHRHRARGQAHRRSRGRPRRAPPRRSRSSHVERRVGRSPEIGRAGP